MCPFGSVDARSRFSGASRSVLISGRTIASGQLPPRMAPLRFFVHRSVGDAAHGADETAIGADDVAGKLGPRRFVHKRHELIREPGHGAADADAAHIGAAADAPHPSPLGYVAVDHGSP